MKCMALSDASRSGDAAGGHGARAAQRQVVLAPLVRLLRPLDRDDKPSSDVDGNIARHNASSIAAALGSPRARASQSWPRWQ